MAPEIASRPELGADGLTAFFLILIAAIALPAGLVLWAEIKKGEIAASIGWIAAGFVGAMALLTLARDVLTFLAAWELMTVLPAASILINTDRPAARRAVLIYLGTTHIGGAGVWIALLGLASGGPVLPLTIVGLIGFATKAGMVPLHFWLPRAHPLAPASISALMSAVMISLPVYGMIRLLFGWAAPAPAGLGYALLALGTLSALIGIFRALLEVEIKRILAFSSIENIGLAVAALGAALLFEAAGDRLWAGVAFGACLFQLAAHGAAKATLFIGAGSFAAAVGALELDRLGGLIRSMPVTAAAFALAGCSLAVLPPLTGFVAEWLIVQAVIHLAMTLSGVGAFAAAVAVAALGASAALALFCFVKLIGMALLGAARRAECETASDATGAVRLALVLLAVPLLLLGPLGGLALPILAGVMPAVSAEALGSIAAIDLPAATSLPVLSLPVVGFLVGAVVWRIRGGRRADPAPAWACGQPAAPELAWSGAGFVKTLTLSLTFRPGPEVAAPTAGVVPVALEHLGERPHSIDDRLLRRALAVLLAAADRVRRLQSGSLRLYLIYLAGTALFALVLARIGVIG